MSSPAANAMTVASGLDASKAHTVTIVRANEVGREEEKKRRKEEEERRRRGEGEEKERERERGERS